MTLSVSTQTGGTSSGSQSGASGAGDQSGFSVQVEAVWAFSAAFSSAFDSDAAQ